MAAIYAIVLVLLYAAAGNVSGNPDFHYITLPENGSLTITNTGTFDIALVYEPDSGYYDRIVYTEDDRVKYSRTDVGSFPFDFFPGGGTSPINFDAIARPGERLVISNSGPVPARFHVHYHYLAHLNIVQADNPAFHIITLPENGNLTFTNIGTFDINFMYIHDAESSFSHVIYNQDGTVFHSHTNRRSGSTVQPGNRIVMGNYGVVPARFRLPYDHLAHLIIDRCDNPLFGLITLPESGSLVFTNSGTFDINMLRLPATASHSYVIHRADGSMQWGADIFGGPNVRPGEKLVMTRQGLGEPPSFFVVYEHYSTYFNIIQCHAPLFYYITLPESGNLTVANNGTFDIIFNHIGCSSFNSAVYRTDGTVRTSMRNVTRWTITLQPGETLVMAGSSEISERTVDFLVPFHLIYRSYLLLQ